MPSLSIFAQKTSTFTIEPRTDVSTSRAYSESSISTGAAESLISISVPSMKTPHAPKSQ
jgi:hypothetical protein